MCGAVLRMVCGVSLCLGGCGVGLPLGRLRLRPDRAGAIACNERGLVALGQQRWAEAVAEFEAALAKDHTYGEAHNNLGVALLQWDPAKNAYAAGVHLTYAVSLLRASAPRANLGILYERLGCRERAESNLRSALALAPDDVQIMGLLARLQVRGGKPQTKELVAWLKAVATAHEDEIWRSWAAAQLLPRESAKAEDGRAP